MREVLAGFVMGYLAAIIWTGLGIIGLAKSRRTVALVRQIIPPQLSLVLVMVPLSMLAFLWCTALGMAMGLLYRGVRERLPQGGLGSPNLAFTLGILASALLPLLLSLPLLQRGYWPFLAMVVSYIALFGWAMPLLAEA